MSEYADGYDDGKGAVFDELMVEIATLRDALSRLIKVHDAMGGKCGTVRIAAEEALAKEGKAQSEYERGFDDGYLRKEKNKGAKSEYICTCGIRVTPHKCPTDNDF